MKVSDFCFSAWALWHLHFLEKLFLEQCTTVWTRLMSVLIFECCVEDEKGGRWATAVIVCLSSRLHVWDLYYICKHWDFFFFFLSQRECYKIGFTHLKRILDIFINFVIFVWSVFVQSWITWKVMEFKWLISRPGEVMEIFKNVKSYGKLKYTITKMTFWPNIKCDIPGNILMHTHDGPIAFARLGTKRSYNFHILSWKSHGI